MGLRDPSGLPAVAKLKFVPALSFFDARETVLREIRAGLTTPATESIDLATASGRVLAEDILADRDYPPFDRSMRDGFGVCAADLPGELKIVGEVRAGETLSGSIQPGEAVEIMTGAPVPEGVESVVMVERTSRRIDHTIYVESALKAGDNISPRGCEARAGSVLLYAGTRLDFAGIACLAAVGKSSVTVFAKPRIAILPTGDEIVDVGETPGESQIRNSNAWSLAAQVKRAGGTPVMLPIARDTKEHTRKLIEQGLECDLLLLSGGVSAGKYDVVEPVLADLGAQFFFDRVKIQPGAPAVFGRARNRFFFGLPGNPASTMVTFEILARAAIGLLSGETETSLPFTFAKLTGPFHHKPGMTRFLPALLRGGGVTPVAWKGSGDIAALCRANAWLVADPERTDYEAGDLISVILR